MLKVGVTGGIGSGKSTICKIFECIGIPVYYADDRAKQLMVDNIKIVDQITEIFGKEAYHEDGSLNRAHLATIVFNDKEKLNMLNGIVHPAVREDGQNWHQSQQNVPYTIKEAALMIESGNYKSMDEIIVVSAPVELRIQRVIQRDAVTRQAVMARIDKQLPEPERLAFADYVIVNDGKKSIVQQVWDIHQELLSF
ncbi:MAG: dephospho-CoA kinase [Bacteroidota bacterium]